MKGDRQRDREREGVSNRERDGNIGRYEHEEILYLFTHYATLYNCVRRLSSILLFHTASKILSSKGIHGITFYQK